MLRVRLGGSSAKHKNWTIPEFCCFCGKQIPVKKGGDAKSQVRCCNRCKTGKIHVTLTHPR